MHPFPRNAHDPDAEFGVSFSANAAQGVFDPFTPMGLQTFRLLGAAFASAIGRPVRDPAAGTPVTVVAGIRLFLHPTPGLPGPPPRELPRRGVGGVGGRSPAVFPPPPPPP